MYSSLKSGRIIIIIFPYILDKEVCVQYHKEETVRGRDFHISLFLPIKKSHKIKISLIKKKKKKMI